MGQEKAISIFWFRRDLRLDDNTALYHCLRENSNVLPLFIFDESILNKLENKTDRRVHFILLALESIQNRLTGLGSTLLVKHGSCANIFNDLVQQYTIDRVYANHDYEPEAIIRDKQVEALLTKSGATFHTYKDQVIFEKDEVLKEDGKPYTIFTPYMRKWKSRLATLSIEPYPSESLLSSLMKITASRLPSIEDIGFKPTDMLLTPAVAEEDLIKNYTEQRDYPAINGTTRVSIHLRFGTVSIRQLAKKASELNGTWFNELIWREFYMMILYHFPHVVNSAFKPAYNLIEWRNNDEEFKRWCDGTTGFPIVDAGMRELNETGFMHNRVRMITASFLVKDLLIDWRWGEAYFAKKLNDFELASNNGGWQWAAGSGCDAAPYFRIFNPTEQTKKFDSEFKYIRKWISNVNDFSYPQPMVDHKFARERTLAAYKKALKNQI